jgi:hypothetical protein
MFAGTYLAGDAEERRRGGDERQRGEKELHGCGYWAR